MDESSAPQQPVEQTAFMVSRKKKLVAACLLSVLFILSLSSFLIYKKIIASPARCILADIPVPGYLKVTFADVVSVDDAGILKDKLNADYGITTQAPGYSPDFYDLVAEIRTHGRYIDHKYIIDRLQKDPSVEELYFHEVIDKYDNKIRGIYYDKVIGILFRDNKMPSDFLQNNPELAEIPENNIHINLKLTVLNLFPTDGNMANVPRTTSPNIKYFISGPPAQLFTAFKKINNELVNSNTPQPSEAYLRQSHIGVTEFSDIWMIFPSSVSRQSIMDIISNADLLAEFDIGDINSIKSEHDIAVSEPPWIVFRLPKNIKESKIRSELLKNPLIKEIEGMEPFCPLF